MHSTRLTATLIAFICGVAAHLGAASAGTAKQPQRILFLGDSLTAGYGVTPEEAYPALVEEKIDAAGLPYTVVAAGLSGETSAGGLRRVDWVLQRPADILVLALGSNDGLRGIDVTDTRSNLQGIIDKARARHPDIRIVVAGMRMPPNLGESYTTRFQSIFRELAEANQATFIPFLLEGVGGNPDLNIADGIHPNPQGHAVIAETVWEALEPLLRASS